MLLIHAKGVDEPSVNRYILSSKTCLKRPLKKNKNIGFQLRLSINAGQKYCRCSKGSILKYFRPSFLSFHFPLRPLSSFKWPLQTGFTVLWQKSRPNSIPPIAVICKGLPYKIIWKLSCNPTLPEYIAGSLYF